MKQCPSCGRVIVSHERLTAQRPPRPGDYTVCAECLSVLRFTDRGGLEVADLQAAPLNVRNALSAAIAQAKMQRGQA